MNGDLVALKKMKLESEKEGVSFLYDMFYIL